MLPDFGDIFLRYEQLRDKSDAIFHRMADLYPRCVTCHAGCADCCHALFDLSLIEAMYLNHVFRSAFKYGPQRSHILERASERDRDLTRFKRGLYRAEKEGQPTSRIMDRAAEVRMACPLLDDENRCLLYDARPITCRLYGIPLDIGGNGFVCGLSGFEKGVQYPSVQLGRIQSQLEEMSAEIATRCNSQFDLKEVYVPVSMALLTEYNEKYLGIEPVKED